MTLHPTTALLAASLACMVGIASGTADAQSPPPGAPPAHHGPPPGGMPPPPHGDHRPPPPHGGRPPPPHGHPVPPPPVQPAPETGATQDVVEATSDAPEPPPAMPEPPVLHPAPESQTPPARAIDAPQAAAPRAAPVAPMPTTDASVSPSPWLMASLLAALALMMFGWWRARRHGRQLAEQARKLDREQRLLKSAHQTLKAHSEQLREQSTLDPLTGVLNRQAFASELRESIAHLSRYDRPLNLIVFDLDHFKSINDRQGHLAGDTALKLVVGIVREHLVSADLFGRFGGDEFLIACADQPLDACRALAERIRVAVQTRAATHSPALPGLTLSLGLAQADGDTGYHPDALFARADAALYEAKRQGRNRIIVADNTTPDLPADATHERHL